MAAARWELVLLIVGLKWYQAAVRRVNFESCNIVIGNGKSSGILSVPRRPTSLRLRRRSHFFVP